MALVHLNKTSLAELLHRYYLFLTILQRWKIEVFCKFFFPLPVLLNIYLISANPPSGRSRAQTQARPTLRVLK